MILSFKNLGKQFGSHWALRGASGNINEKDYIGLVGPNGAGKTTLLRLLCRVYRPNEGQVEYTPGFSGRAFFFSTPGMFYPALTAIENISFYQQLFNQPDSSPLASLDACGLERFADTRVETFSTGMLQRLNIAAMISVRPAFLFLDEPFTGLDVEGQQLLSGILKDRELSPGNPVSAFVLVDHNHERLASLASLAWRVEDGQLQPGSSLAGAVRP